MYIIKVKIYAEGSEYLIFNNEDEFKEFIKDNIIMNNVDYNNFYDNTRYLLSDPIYVSREIYSDDDIYDAYYDNIVSSNEFGSKYKMIKNFENVSRIYFKKMSFDYDYKIIINLDFSDDDSDENEDFSENGEDKNDENEDEYLN